jgi:hypothetical protein
MIKARVNCRREQEVVRGASGYSVWNRGQDECPQLLLFSRTVALRGTWKQPHAAGAYELCSRRAVSPDAPDRMFGCVNRV